MPLRNPQNLLLSAPTARGGYVARDVEKTSIFFSPALFEERHGSSFQRRQPLARFLGSFFAARQRMNINTGTARRAAVRASKETVVKPLAIPQKSP